MAAIAYTYMIVGHLTNTHTYVVWIDLPVTTTSA